MNFINKGDEKALAYNVISYYVDIPYSMHRFLHVYYFYFARLINDG